MSISIDWGTKIIFIPKADLTLISANIYSLDVHEFHLWLKDLEDSVEGMAYPDTHKHTTETELAGITYARFVEIINGYTIEFEAGNYAVNLTGANNNLADVTPCNGVSIRSNNSAGLIHTVSGSGVTEQDKLDIADRVWDEAITDHSEDGTMGHWIQKKMLTVAKFIGLK